jgi:hypothetical protein
VFPPAFGDEVEEGVDVGEGQASGAFLVGDGWEETTGVIGVVDERCEWIWGEMETEELVVLDQIFCDGVLASTDAWSSLVLEISVLVMRDTDFHRCQSTFCLYFAGLELIVMRKKGLSYMRPVPKRWWYGKGRVAR